MTATANTCGICDAPTDATICHDDTTALGHDLRLAGGWWERDARSPVARRWIHGLLHDLLMTGARMGVAPRTSPENDDDALTLDSRYPATTAMTAAPAHLAALTGHRELNAVIADLAAIVSAHVTDRPARGYTTLWLGDHLDVIRRHPDAPDLATRLQRAVERAEQLIQAPRKAVTIACKCRRRVDLTTDAGDVIRCPCGEWGTLQWWRDNHAPTEPDGPVTLVQAKAWLLAEHSLDIELETLRTWSKRGDLGEATRDDRNRKRHDAMRILARAHRENLTA